MLSTAETQFHLLQNRVWHIFSDHRKQQAVNIRENGTVTFRPSQMQPAQTLPVMMPALSLLQTDGSRTSR